MICFLSKYIFFYIFCNNTSADKKNPEVTDTTFMGTVQTKTGYKDICSACIIFLCDWFYDLWYLDSLIGCRSMLFALVAWEQHLPPSLQLGSYFACWALSISAGFQLGFLTFLNTEGKSHEKEAISQVTRSDNIIVVEQGLFVNTRKRPAGTIPSGCFSSAGHPQSKNILTSNQW